MTRLLLFCSLTLSLSALTNCSGGAASDDDPVAAARARNEKQIDTADITEKQQADADFLVNATANTLLAVELGKLAQQRASTTVVRGYGPRLVQQRLELLRALQSLAAAKHLTLPADLGADARAAYHEVSTEAGAHLDQQLLKRLTKLMSQDADAFEDMAEDAYDGDIRGLAVKQLPSLREQLAMAREVEDEVEDLP